MSSDIQRDADLVEEVLRRRGTVGYGEVIDTDAAGIYRMIHEGGLLAVVVDGKKYNPVEVQFVFAPEFYQGQRPVRKMAYWEQRTPEDIADFAPPQETVKKVRGHNVILVRNGKSYVHTKVRCMDTHHNCTIDSHWIEEAPMEPINRPPGHEACDLDRTCSGGPYKCLQED